MAELSLSWGFRRLLAAVGGVFFAAYAIGDSVTWLLASPGEFRPYGIRILTLGTAAAMCCWFALRGHRPDSRADMRFGCLTGGVVGGIAFWLGLLIPIILSPEANQGPLLGILITGPLGAVIGTIIGVLIAKVRRLKSAG